MDDTSAFKTQWLNETLKFIKNDHELMCKYPEWPISRVAFYHALMAQRQLSAGLGFKTLYAPLWEAMQVFGLKYTFKVTIENSKDEEKGYLVLEKIPKKIEDNESDSEEESTCKHKLTKKAEQAYLTNKAIVERNSPTFIKNTLQSLLGFINDEASASIDFKDLAPIEAKFVQSIQAIHEQKFLFYKIFTPSAIEILKKISMSLKSFSNSYNIKVGNVRTNPKTAKREITLIKEPNFGSPSPSSSTPSKSPNKKRSKSKPRSSPAPLRSPKSINVKPIPSFQDKSRSVSQNDGSKNIKAAELKEILDKIEDVKQLNTIIEVANTTGRPAKSRLINVEDASNSESGKENIPSNANKTEIQLDTTSDKSKEENYVEVTESKKSAIIKKINSNAKESMPANNTKPSLSRSGQKKAMLEAMSVPMESDKGLRMMKSMGWEGGALGARGDGIMEPIIPALHLKPKAGLGAPPAKIPKDKPVPKTKKGKKESKTCIKHFQFLEGVYEALAKGNSIIRFKRSLNTKEVKFFGNNVVELNRRARVSHNSLIEKNLVNKILDKLNQMPDKIFDYSFTQSNSELCLQVINKVNETSTPPPDAPKRPMPEKLLAIDEFVRDTRGKPRNRKAIINKLSVKLYTLEMVADFVDSDDIVINMDFSFGHCKKMFQYMQHVCDTLNEGKKTKKIKVVEEIEMLKHISAGLKHAFLSVHLFSPFISVRKLKLSSKHRQMINYYELFDILTNNTKMENVESDSESDNEVETKISNSQQNVTTEPNNDQKLDSKDIKNVKIDFTEDFYDMINFKKNDKEIPIIKEKDSSPNDTDKRNEILEQVVVGTTIQSNSPDEEDKDRCNDLLIENLNTKDDNDNIVLNGDRPSEIEPTNKSCDTSDKNNINFNAEVQKDNIDVLEYKEYSIVKIVLQDWEELKNLSRKIQEDILNCDYFIEDTYLKCHGIQNGGLVYYCSNEDWFKDVLRKNFNANYSFKTIEKFKMKVHINSFIKVEDVLKALEVQNRGLHTTDWSVVEEGSCYFVADVDCDSFQFVCDRRFSLFAGVDTALFTIVL